MYQNQGRSQRKGSERGTSLALGAVEHASVEAIDNLPFSRRQGDLTPHSPGLRRRLTTNLSIDQMVHIASRTECCEFVIIVRANSAIDISLTTCKQMAMP